jgi:hypothetical protein
MKSKNSTRLGEILIDKGLITAQQLDTAIQLQNHRRKLAASDNLQGATSLGEILIELGFIDRLQLRRGLNWQLVLRKMTLAMAIVAPFMSMGAAAASSSSSSSSSSSASAKTLPLTIQAEDYTSMSGIQTQVTTDAGGGSNVGYIDTGDWMSYKNVTVNIPATGAYTFTYRVASPAGGGSFVLKNADSGAVYDTVPVPSTGSFQTWTNVTRTVNLTAGTHSFLISIAARGTGFNLNWFNIAGAGDPLPVTVQAEDYTSMSGVQTQATTDQGGGFNVAYLDAGDWMSYSNKKIFIPATGNYKVTYRVASPGGGASFALKDAVTNVKYDTVAVPNTGGFQNWINVEHIVTLAGGTRSFAIADIVRGTGVNINWFKIESLSNTSSSSLSSSSSSSSVSSVTSSVSSSTNSSVASSASSVDVADNAGFTIVSVGGPVALSWLVPNKRENGEPLDITEIAGYELRYRKDTDEDFVYVTINDPWTNMYNFPYLTGNYIFQVATFDKNGVYSNFINLTPK